MHVSTPRHVIYRDKSASLILKNNNELICHATILAYDKHCRRSYMLIVKELRVERIGSDCGAMSRQLPTYFLRDGIPCNCARACCTIAGNEVEFEANPPRFSPGPIECKYRMCSM